MHSVSEYLKSLAEGEQPLSPTTIRGYKQALSSYANFLGVNVDKLHLHLTPENLLKYGEHLKGHKPSTISLNMTIVRRFYWINSVNIANGRLEEATLKRRKKVNPNAHNDIPLTKTMLQDMMAAGDVRSRAILAFLISTGARANECVNVLISDVKGDTVTLRDEICKGGHGGTVYLTSEAKDYLDKWLEVRDSYLVSAEKRNKTLLKHGKKTGTRPKKDNRLFGIGYNSLIGIFTRLYRKTGGERVAGKVDHEYRNPVTGEVKIAKPTYAQLTPHSCRRYFNTHAEETMTKSLVEFLMRHTGYLSSSYYRNEKARKEFLRGESALYINKGREESRDEETEALKEQITRMQKDHALLIAQLQEKNILPLATHFRIKEKGKVIAEYDHEFKTE